MHVDGKPGGGPLHGTTVVGLEHSVAGPLCTRILGDLGAEVIKVERPAGDFARHWDANARGEGAQFWWLNRGKRSVVLDLRAPGARAQLDALLARADVLVHNLSPAAAGRLGLDAPELHERLPRLVSCQVSGYGADGPLAERKAYDMLVQAEAGLMSMTGLPGRPMRSGVSICDVSTGMYAAVLILGALAERERTGRGRRLDLAMFDVATEFLGPMLVSFLNSGTIYPRIPDRHHAIAPYGVFECADGERVLIAIEQDREWAAFCASVLGEPALAHDPRFASNAARIDNREALEALVADAFARRPAHAVVALLEELGLAYARLNDVADVAAHPVLAARHGVVEVESAAGVPVQALAGLGQRAFGTAPPARDRPPALGEDTAELLAGLASQAGTNGDEAAGSVDGGGAAFAPRLDVDGR